MKFLLLALTPCIIIVSLIEIVLTDCDRTAIIYKGKEQHYRPQKFMNEIDSSCITGIIIPPIYKKVCVKNITVCKIESEPSDCRTSEVCDSCEKDHTCKDQNYVLEPKDPSVIGIIGSKPQTDDRDNQNIELRGKKGIFPLRYIVDELEEHADEFDGLTLRKPRKCCRIWDRECKMVTENVCAEWSTVTTCVTKFNDPILGPQVCCNPIIEYPGTTLYVDAHNNPIPEPKFQVFSRDKEDNEESIDHGPRDTFRDSSQLDHVDQGPISNDL